MSQFTTTLHSAAGATGGGLWLDVRDFEGVAIQLLSTGTPAGTLSFQGSLSADKSNVVAVTMFTNGDPTTPVTSTTAAGIFWLPSNHALYWLRANITVFTSGAFSVIASRRSSRYRQLGPTAAVT